LASTVLSLQTKQISFVDKYYINISNMEFGDFSSDVTLLGVGIILI